MSQENSISNGAPYHPIRQILEDELTPDFKRQKTGFNVRSLKYNANRTNDEIHSNINFCPVMKIFIDTPHFQRLRGLKQLGTSVYTYMNANHSRFEHSLGVAHLAKQVVTRLKQEQPILNITDKDVLCVTLAGLLHDIGHGPYSHLYDAMFPRLLEKYLECHPEFKKNYEGLPKRPEGWEHEDGSNMMIDALLAHKGLQIDIDDLDGPLKQIGDGIAADSIRVFTTMPSNAKDCVLTSRDWIFIKEAIKGKPLEESTSRLALKESGFVGRPDRGKEFLYDIVSNRHSGLDVDKIDYFARDERRVLKGNGEVDQRLIEETIVSWGTCPKCDECFRCKHALNPGKHLMIVWPVKCVEMICAFFHKRFRAHSSVYTHRTTQATTFMVCDILTLADPFYRIRVVDDVGGKKSEYHDGLPISRAMVDPDTYLRLKDSIIDIIANTDQSELREARLLIRRLEDRELYTMCASRKIRMDDEKERKLFQKTELDIQKEMVNLGGTHTQNGRTLELTNDDFHVERLKIHLGTKDVNPLRLFRFLKKDEMNKLRLTQRIEDLPEAIEVDERDYETHLPLSFQENSIRVYCRSEEKLDFLKHVFGLFCSQYEDAQVQNIGQTEEVENTDQPHVLTQDLCETPARAPFAPDGQSPKSSVRRNLAFAG